MPSAARLAKSVCNEKGLQFLRPSLDSALPHCLPPITIPNCGEPVFTLDQGEDAALKPRIIVRKIREPEVTSNFPVRVVVTFRRMFAGGMPIASYVRPVIHRRPNGSTSEIRSTPRLSLRGSDFVNVHRNASMSFCAILDLSGS